MPLPAGCSSGHRLSRLLSPYGPVPTAEELSRTLAMFAARRASTPTLHLRPRSDADVAQPSRLESEHSRSGTG